MITQYLAHSPTDEKPTGQPLIEHLEKVSALASEFCHPFGAEEDGRLCGLYHDIGKYSDAFQRRLSGSPETVDHSSAGALLLFEKKNIPVSMCIAGHHSGLADMGSRNDLTNTYMARIKRAQAGMIEDCNAWKKEISVDIPSGYKPMAPLGTYFYTKMLFSALTDADWLDTEAYYQSKEYTSPPNNIGILWDKLELYINPWWNAKNEINIRRCQILRASIDHGNDSPGLFTLTVPTGGGKTVSSMAFALRHAMETGKRRVIYVIPYCSILEQTRAVFENIFGKQYITAHYSGAEYDHNENASDDTRAFSSENWDAPIILTTAVQFFESLYASKPGKNRKLHNITESVIIFDEAQMLPVPFLRPCLASITQLVKDFQCTAVLCTATQPSLNPLLNEFAPELPVREICPTPDKMYQDFRRVTYVNEGLYSDDELACELKKRSQVLCIVNSRKQAQSLYHLLSGEEGVFHLSTMMIPQDRKNILKIIRKRLRDDKPCKVISTSLIEAGVDVDFPEVFRALAGLDSIIQAGGRCNREGKREPNQSIVHIFQSEAKAPWILEQNIAAATRTLKNHLQADSPEAIMEYFDFLFYTLKDQGQLDQRGILEDVYKLNFSTVSDRFHLIDGADYIIYIPVRNGANLIKELQTFGPSRALLRNLSEYSVAVYKQYFNTLLDTGVLEIISDKAGVLKVADLYSSETGLPFEISEQDKALINLKERK